MVKVNIDELKQLMADREVTTDSLAAAMNINRSTLYRKFNEGGIHFTAEDIFKMREFIPLTDREVVDIFLTQKVALPRHEPTA
jgi:predicted transcriptional regulator